MEMMQTVEVLEGKTEQINVGQKQSQDRETVYLEVRRALVGRKGVGDGGAKIISWPGAHLEATPNKLLWIEALPAPGK